jgi:CheY-like chemotaxis protein
MNEKKKILYVDDEPMNILLFTTILKDRYEIYTAENGREGLEILTNNLDVKLVVSDWMMPVMDGLNFANAVNSQFSKVDFYLLSGYELTEEVQKLIESDIVKGYLKKPLDIGALSF